LSYRYRKFSYVVCSARMYCCEIISNRNGMVLENKCLHVFTLWNGWVYKHFLLTRRNGSQKRHHKSQLLWTVSMFMKRQLQARRLGNDLICANEIQMEDCQPTNKPNTNKGVDHEYNRCRWSSQSFPHGPVLCVH
jgi:hypothetical protein